MPAPHAELVVDGHLPEVQLHAAIKAACRHLLPAWAGLQDADIAISFISGGISNALFKVAPVAAASGSAHGAGAADSGNGSSSAASSGPPPPVAFRVYGDNTEQFVDRSRELGIMALVHSNGFGPQVLGTFSNGRIEEFLFKRCLQVGAGRLGGWAAGCCLPEPGRPGQLASAAAKRALTRCLPPSAGRSLRRWLPPSLCPPSPPPCDASTTSRHWSVALAQWASCPAGQLPACAAIGQPTQHTEHVPRPSACASVHPHTLVIN